MPVINRFLFLLSLLVLPYLASAQADAFADIKQQLRKPGIHDTTRITLINQIIDNSVLGDSLFVHYNEEVRKIIFANLQKTRISKKEREFYLYNLAYWYHNQAAANFSVSKGRQAVLLCDKSIALFKEVGSPEEVLYVMATKGNILRKIGAYKEAINIFFYALSQQEKMGDLRGATTTYCAIAALYEEQENNRMALQYYQKALGNLGKINDNSPQHLHETAVIMHNVGFQYARIGQNAKAREYYSKALELARKNGFRDNMALDLEKLGDIYLEEKNYDAALASFDEAIKLTDNPRSSAAVLNAIGKTYLKKGEYSKAVATLQKGLSAAQEAGDRTLISSAFHNLYEAYKELGQPARALEMYEKYHRNENLSDLEESKDALERQQIKYDYEKKQLIAKAAADRKLAATRLAGEKAASRRNQFIYLLISLLVILGGIAYFIYYNSKQRAARVLHRNNELKQKLLLSQMNPHFIFNSIDNIQGLIYAGEEKLAVKYLTRFSVLTRQILENSRENYILLSEEVEMLENYLNIQQMLHNSRFGFSIELDPEIDPEMLLVPPMLTQPFVENAIKHGLKEKPDGGMIIVNYSMENGELCFEVTDNGSGLAENVPGHKSLSTTITLERLESITGQNTATITTSEIKNGNEIAGVKTSLVIPFILNN